MNQLTETVVTIATAIIGLAILSVIVSNRSNTANVITSAGGVFTDAIRSATSPVTGSGSFGGFESLSFN